MDERAEAAKARDRAVLAAKEEFRAAERRRKAAMVAGGAPAVRA